MNKLLLIYAAVIFIAGVVFFTIGQLNISKEGQDEETVEFFKSHDYFGYNPKYIKFFKQGNLPLLLD